LSPFYWRKASHQYDASPTGESEMKLKVSKSAKRSE